MNSERAQVAPVLPAMHARCIVPRSVGIDNRDAGRRMAGGPGGSVTRPTCGRRSSSGDDASSFVYTEPNRRMALANPRDLRRGGSHHPYDGLDTALTLHRFMSATKRLAVLSWWSRKEAEAATGVDELARMSQGALLLGNLRLSASVSPGARRQWLRYVGSPSWCKMQPSLEIAEWTAPALATLLRTTAESDRPPG